MVEPDPCDDSMLELVHTKAFIDAVKAEVGNVAFGLGTPDVPVFDGMHAASARVVGATLAATRAVYEGRAVHAVNVAGGLHHAMPAAASGFCVYNDPAVAIAWLLAQGVQRVAYVDIDVHHGDGVQAAFYDDPVKQASDAASTANAYYVRSIATDASLRWRARRWANAVARQIGIGALRDLRERIAAGAHMPVGGNI